MTDLQGTPVRQMRTSSEDRCAAGPDEDCGLGGRLSLGYIRAKASRSVIADLKTPSGCCLLLGAMPRQDICHLLLSLY
jgi:hypothetical protein